MILPLCTTASESEIKQSTCDQNVDFKMFQQNTVFTIQESQQF